MRNVLLFLLLCISPLLVVPSVATAADPPVQAVADAETTPGWHALYLRFETGQTEAALALIRTHFAPIDSTFGRRLVVLGEAAEWDAIIFTRLVADPSGETWVTNPVPEIWLEALAAQEGGMDGALRVLQRFDAFIDASETDLLIQSDAPEWAMRVLG